jgi:CMP/dCMP kinase
VSSKRLPIIAIDGPAGAGKSTAARLLAARLRYLLANTGALYRALALAAQRAGIAWDNHEEMASLCNRLVSERQISLTTAIDDPQATDVLLFGKHVSEEIRTPEISQAASSVSAIPGVRQALLGLQRDIAAQGGVILEGRDIGTVVCPDAELKFFVTASPEVRAQRRFEEQQVKGNRLSYEETLSQVIQRDLADSTREIAPLVPAKDAIHIDTSTLSLPEVVDVMAEHVTRFRSQE